MRVLVVDDNSTNRILIQRQMEKLGCSVAAVAEGAAALAKFQSEDFGLVLMDCQMPERDGLDTTQDIRRAEGGRSRTPIVGVSADTSPENVRRCLDAGMDDFIAKPATLEALERVLGRWDRPFDETALASFAALAAPSKEALDALVSDFLDDSRARLHEARKAREAGDLKACASAAHAVKGASATIGARGLRELSRRIEASAKAGDSAGELESLMAQAEDELARLGAKRPDK